MKRGNKRQRGRLPESSCRSPESLLRQAKALMAACRFEEALRVFSQAAREHRFNVSVLIDAARANFSRYRPERAIGLLDRALQVGRRNPMVHVHVGETFRRQGLFARAETCFRRVLTLLDEAPAAELELAFLCERTHRLEESLEFSERLLRRQPSLGPAVVQQARTLRRLRRTAAAESLLAGWLRQASPSPWAAEGWAELALLFDECGRFDEAWQAIESCKDMLRPHSVAPRQAADHVMARFDRLTEALTRQHVDRWLRGSPPETDAPGVALLTGFPRSGTTLLEQVLDAHPGILAIEEKDVLASETFRQISHDSADAAIEVLLDELSDPERDVLRRQYLQYMLAGHGNSLGDRLLLDKNPALTKMIPVALRLFPGARFIIMVRDPRDVVLSCYLRYLPLNPVSVSFLSLERTVQRYLSDLRAWWKVRELLPREQWCEVRYEDLVADLPATTEKVLRCLHLQWSDHLAAFQRPLQGKIILSPSYDAVMRPVTSQAIGRWRHYRRYLEPGLAALTPALEALGYGD